MSEIVNVPPYLEGVEHVVAKMGRVDVPTNLIPDSSRIERVVLQQHHVLLTTIYRIFRIN